MNSANEPTQFVAGEEFMLAVAELMVLAEVFHSQATIPASVTLGSSTPTSVDALPAISPAENTSPPPPEVHMIFIVGAAVVVTAPEVNVVTLESSTVVDETLSATEGTENSSTTIA